MDKHAKKYTFVPTDAPVLHQKTKKIKDPSDPKLVVLIEDMFKVLHESHGVGLAAPQIGLGERICVIEEGGNHYVLINPSITKYSKETVVMEEGCLSVPGKFFPIERPAEVNATFTTLEGKRAKLRASGLLARALQHEIDHLNGIIILDHINKK